MSEHESPRTTSRATEHDTETTDQPTTAATQGATAYPRRRDVHHPEQGRTRRALRLPRSRRTRRTVVPVALTVMALSTGMAAGVAAAATDGHGTTTTTVSGTSATDARQATTTAFGKVTTASSAQTAAAEKAVTRAEAVTTGASEVSSAQRKKIGALSDDVRALVEDSTPATATAPASRSTDREALDDRDDDAAAGTGAAEGHATQGDDDGSTDDVVAAPATDAIAPATLNATPVAAITATTDDRGTDAASRDGSRTDRDAAGTATSDERSQLADKTASLQKLLDKSEKSTVNIEPAAPEPTKAPAASHEKTATAQEGDAPSSAAYLAEHADDTDGYGNGEVPESELCELSFAPGSMLRCDATAQLERLDQAYQADFGTHLEITDSYRSYASQVAVKASRGWLAAVPGTSNHGWAVAVDLGGGVESFGSAQYMWMQENAASYGWHQPGWAQAGGGKPEAWHWEYQAS